MPFCHVVLLNKINIVPCMGYGTDLPALLYIEERLCSGTLCYDCIIIFIKKWRCKFFVKLVSL